jgi:oligoendopeptidase F
LKLRQRLLELDELCYYDLYAPMIQRVQMRYPYEKAREVLAEALMPLGKRYVKDLSRGLDPKNGWVDPYPNLGKRSGAYMDGSAYDVHPFVLGNYLDDYNSMSMLAHEMGHAMHSYYSNRSQPFAKADYSIFVAEVASTLNEALLSRFVIDREKNKRRRLFLLGEQLEGFRQTMFRQTMFAEFELAMYERAEQGQALTSEALTDLYLRVARETYGHDEGVVEVAASHGVEWAYIPHFYYNFYVFQYVTGMTAAMALSERILDEGPKAAKQYYDHLLCAGGSDAPIDILRRAGVDLTTDEPYDLAMRAFSRAIDQVEGLLD